MPGATIFGLALIGAGILAIAIAEPLNKVSANSRAYLRPGLDKAAFSRRNVRIIRVMCLVWIFLGTGFSIFGLVTGR